MKPAGKSDNQNYQSIADNYNRQSADISVQALEAMRSFMSKQLGMAIEPSIEAFGANLEENLFSLLRAATVKMHAQGNLIDSMEKRLAGRFTEQKALNESRNTLQSERDANAILTKDVEALEEEVILRQACIDGKNTEIKRLRGVLQRLADWGGVTAYRGGQCWQDVAREALEPVAATQFIPDEPGWIVRHDKYGKWFISRAAVIIDWKQDHAQACPNEPAREPSNDEVETWFGEQISWIEIARDGKQIERPDMVAVEQSWSNDMKHNADYVSFDYDAEEVFSRVGRKSKAKGVKR